MAKQTKFEHPIIAASNNIDKAAYEDGARGTATPESSRSRQEQLDAIRATTTEQYPEKYKDNMKLIEDFCKECQARNIPFILFANPAEYNFDAERAYGYYRYQSVSGKYAPYTSEANAHVRLAMPGLLEGMVRFLQGVYTGKLDIIVVDKNKRIL